MPRMIGQGNSASWPDSHLETLRRMWSAGKTGKEIAAVIPYSRCAVCAKARRLGLEERPRKGPASRASRAQPKAALAPIAKRIDQAVGLVADHNWPLREAAERTNVPFNQFRAYYNWLIADKDMTEPPEFGDDVVRGPERPPSSWTPLEDIQL